jgi:hypothetical protein
LFHAVAEAVSTVGGRTQFPTEQDPDYRFLPDCPAGQTSCNIFRSKEPLLRLLICQAVMITRWEQNK